MPHNAPPRRVLGPGPLPIPAEQPPADEHGGKDRHPYPVPTKVYDHTIGTMKSARDNNLRNAHEFLHEMLAQYLTTGHITFQPITSMIGPSTSVSRT